MQALGPGAVLEEFERARRHAERDALGLPQFAFRQSEQPAGGERGGRRVADAGGMKAGAVEAAARHAGDADRRLDAENIGGQHLPRRRPRHDRCRQRCRKLRHRRVDHAPEVGVVEIEAVADQAVDGRGVAAAPGKRKADDRNRSAGGDRAEAVDRLPGIVEPRHRHADADRVENVVQRALAHGRGDGVIRCPRHECGKSGGDRAGRRPCRALALPRNPRHAASSCDRIVGRRPVRRQAASALR